MEKAIYLSGLKLKKIEMNIWLCRVKPGYWRIIKRKKVFGVPSRAHKKLKEVKVGDLMVYHVFKPIDGIVAIYRVISNPLEDDKEMWKRHKFPHRMRVEPIPEFTENEANPIPLHVVFGMSSNRKEVIIEPDLRGVALFKLNDEQFKRLKDAFRSHT